MAKSEPLIGLEFSRVIRDACDGQSSAFERLYRAYSGSILAFARARGSADPDAVASDVMLRVFQNLGSFSGDESAFVRWIFAIARNLIIDSYRMGLRRPDIADGVELPDRASNRPSTEDTAISQLAATDMATQLGRLTADQSEVIALRMVAGLSLQEVAEIVGKPLTAVKALQRRGLRALQKEILDGVVSK